ncbi:hypothetical protein FRB96_007467 [Tulasnella sp. 330]|nr:hypothetical protein FRB96_007467 [Tulasnella sp. 330]
MSSTSASTGLQAIRDGSAGAHEIHELTANEEADLVKTLPAHRGGDYAPHEDLRLPPALLLQLLVSHLRSQPGDCVSFLDLHLPTTKPALESNLVQSFHAIDGSDSLASLAVPTPLASSSERLPTYIEHLLITALSDSLPVDMVDLKDFEGDSNGSDSDIQDVFPRAIQHVDGSTNLISLTLGWDWGGIGGISDDSAAMTLPAVARLHIYGPLDLVKLLKGQLLEPSTPSSTPQ